MYSLRGMQDPHAGLRLVSCQGEAPSWAEKPLVCGPDSDSRDPEGSTSCRSHGPALTSCHLLACEERLLNRKGWVGCQCRQVLAPLRDVRCPMHARSPESHQC